MKRLILLISISIISFFCINQKVYAKDNITIDSKKISGNKIELTYSVGDEPIYGLYSEIDFDINGIVFEGCSGKNDFSIGFNVVGGNAVLIAESVVPLSKGTIMTCTFNQKSDNTNITIKELNTSNSKVLKRQETSANQIITTSNTFQNTSIIFTLIAFILIASGAYIIIKTKNSKVLLLLIALIPLSVYAAEEYTEENLTSLRNLILQKTKYNDENKKYDLDDDKALSINDLIMMKIDINTPKITMKTTTKGEAAYYTEAKSDVLVTSPTKYQVYYCFGEKNCTPKTEYKNGNDDSSIALENILINYEDNEKAQKLCVKATNTYGLSATKCDDKTYKVDSKKPSFSVKEENHTITINSTKDTPYDTTKNLSSIKYGVGGGKITCTKPATVGTHTITCTAIGNNGLKTEKTYVLNINQKTFKLLFVGNSKTHTAFPGIPTEVKNIAESNGYKVTVKEVTTGGKTLSWHAENSKDELSAVSGYDYLILQEGKDPLMASTADDYKSGAKAVLDIVKKNNPNIKTYIRSLWNLAAEDSDGKFRFIYDHFDQSVTNSEKVANYINATVIYDGKAFKEVDTNHKSILIFVDTTGHQSIAGAYLSGACVYKKIFNKSPVGTEYYPKEADTHTNQTLTRSTADTLLNIANSKG